MLVDFPCLNIWTAVYIDDVIAVYTLLGQKINGVDSST
jgi:hypothetical protein